MYNLLRSLYRLEACIEYLVETYCGHYKVYLSSAYTGCPKKSGTADFQVPCQLRVLYFFLHY